MEFARNEACKGTEKNAEWMCSYFHSPWRLMQKSIFKKSLQKFCYPYRYLSATKHLIVHFYPFAAMDPIFNNWVLFPVKIM